MSGPDRSGVGARSPRTSIVVPVRNGAETIEDCLGSILSLDHPADAFEVIVVDNSSTDRTPAILKRFAGRIRIVQEAKRGAASARNCGVRAARGDLIAFVDADCVVDPQWLSQLLPPLASTRVGIVGGRILATQPCNWIERFGERIHDNQRAIEELTPPYAITMNWASPRAVLEQVGLFDESLLRGQDVDLAWRIHQAGFALVYRPEARVHHRNERTITGLFAEGCVHGYHADAVRTRHRASLPPHMASRMSAVLRALRRAAGSWAAADRSEAVCGFVFNLGKATGECRRALTPSTSEPRR